MDYDAPEKLLLNEVSALSKMVQSTGAANAEYLRSLVLRDEQENKLKRESMHIIGQGNWLVTSHWTAAARHAVAINLVSALKDLQVAEFDESNNIVHETRDAIVTLQGVLEGKHDEQIEETLNNYAVPRDRWWSALYRVIEGNVSIFLSPLLR